MCNVFCVMFYGNGGRINELFENDFILAARIDEEVRS